MPRSPTTLDLLFTRARWTQAEGRAAIDALDTSGLTLAAFAARHSIQAQRLFAWRRKFAAEPAALTRAVPPAFVEFPRQREPRPIAATRYELVLAEGASLRVEGPVDATTVRALLALLREAHAC